MASMLVCFNLLLDIFALEVFIDFGFSLLVEFFDKTGLMNFV